MLSIEIALDAQNHVGESPIWDAKEQALYWVDIIGKAIYRHDPVSGDLQHWFTDDFPTAIALLEQGNGAVLALANGVHLFDFADTMTLLAKPDGHVGNRLNEGKCDPSGRFWVGSMQTNLNADGSGKEMTASTGTLFRVDADGGSERFGILDFQNASRDKEHSQNNPNNNFCPMA